MKQFCISVIVLCFSFLTKSFAQNYHFNKKFCDVGDYYKYTDFTILPSGSVFWVGSDSNDAQILKLDKNFNISWKKLFGGSNSDRFVSIDYLGDNRLLITGQSNSIDGDVVGNYSIGTNAWICIIDTNGNILHQVIYGGAASSQLHFCKVAPNGDIFFCGTTYGDTLDFAASAPFDFLDDGFIACADSFLNKKYLHFFDVVNGNSRVYDLDFLPNGHLIIVASSNVLDGAMAVNTPTPKGATVLMEIDTLANIYWQRRYGSMGGVNVGGTMSNIIKDPNKAEYMLMGNCSYKDGDCWDSYPYLNKGGSNYVWLMKVDSLGNKVWSHIFGSFSDSGTDYQHYSVNYNYIEHSAIVTTETDGIDNYAMGDIIGKVDTWAFQVNMDGQMVKNFRAGFDGAAWRSYLGAKISPYDSIIYYRQRQYVDTVNYYTSYPHACDSQKLKEFTILGTYEFWPSSVQENNIKETYNFKIYPNPASNQVKIDDLLIGGKLEIFSVDGKKMYSEKISSRNITISISNWVSGIYTATITKNKKRATQKFSIY